MPSGNKTLSRQKSLSGRTLQNLWRQRLTCTDPANVDDWLIGELKLGGWENSPLRGGGRGFPCPYLNAENAVEINFSPPGDELGRVQVTVFRKKITWSQPSNIFWLSLYGKILKFTGN